MKLGPQYSKSKDGQIRPCLNCKKDFESEWIGNRLCPSCGGCLEVDALPPLVVRERSVRGMRE